MELKNIQLRQFGKQFKLTRFLLIALIALLFTQIGCSANENKKFNVFLEKFNLIELPIDLASLDRDKAISTDDYALFLNLDSIEWQKKDEFYYFTIARFNLGEFIGLFFQRVYESKDSQNYKIENVLCVFDKKGNLLSSLIVGGSYLIEDSEVNISGDFKTDLTLKINRDEFFKEGDEKNETEYYKINSNTGQIIKK